VGVKVKRIVVCITGASGMIYAVRLLKAASKIKGLETHVVITNPGALVLKQETGLNKEDIKKLASHFYEEKNFMAPIASGSFKVDGTVIVPCSMKTLSAIATGYDDNLVTRVASVTLKERRKLILMTRESPLSIIHLKNMLAVSEAGAMVMPPLHPFYFDTKNIDQLVDITIGKLLNMLGIENNLDREWGIDTLSAESNIYRED
jgi:flavin prenyltransferase